MSVNLDSPGLEVIGMSKRFGALAALDDVSLRVAPGSVHALLGENGAGKSTLVKCIMGFYHADSGNILLDSEEITVRSPRDAQARGIGMVYQHFTLVPSMTVLENLTMGKGFRLGRIDWAAERRALESFLATMPFRVKIDRPVASLAAGEKQKAEILKQLWFETRFLILDEPTSVLTPQEADEMLSHLRAMVADGLLTVLIITHKFREVQSFADEVSVLRRGRFVGGGRSADLSVNDMARMMVGESDLATATERAASASERTLLELDRVSARDDTGQLALRSVSLAVRGGEIVGIAGVSGNGQTTLVEVLAGQRHHEGEVRVQGAAYRATRREMMEHKLALLPEEPLRNACVGRMSVAENIAFRSFDRHPICGGLRVRKRVLRRQAEELMARYKVRGAGPEAPISSLSGGNVQRAVLARELSSPTDILVVANPVFGLDFAAVADIHAQILAARNRGTAVLMVSEDLDELLELADRILVMSGGAVVHETPREHADRTLIGRYMAGHGAAAECDL